MKTNTVFYLFIFFKIWKLEGTTIITVTFFKESYGKTLCFIKLSGIFMKTRFNLVIGFLFKGITFFHYTTKLKENVYFVLIV